MPGESYRRQLRSLLLYLCYVFQVLINSLVLILHERSGPRSVSDLLVQFPQSMQSFGRILVSYVHADLAANVKSHP